MAQKGLMSFFSKSPATTKPKEAKSTLTPTRTNGHPLEEEDGKGSSAVLSNSPILKSKSKRRRVIIESDDDEEGEGGGSDGGGAHTEAVVVLKEDGVVSAENGADKLGVARNLTSPTTTTTDKMDTSSNEGRGVVFETPPKRTTARKHTGKVHPSNSSVCGSGPLPKRPKLSQDTEEGEVVRDDGGDVGGDGDGDVGGAGSDGDMGGGGNVGKGGKGGEGEGVDIVGGDIERESSVSEKKGNKDLKPGKKKGKVEKKKKESVKAKGVKKESVKAKGVKSKMKEVKSRTKSRTEEVKSRTEEVKSEVGDAKDKCSESSSSTNGKPSADGRPSVNDEEGKGFFTDKDYNPSNAHYHPIDHACWKRGQKVPYLALAKTFEMIEEETKRLKIISFLTNFFRSVFLLSPNEMVPCVYLCLNKLAPAYQGVELGIGESVLVKAIAAATGRRVQQIKAEATEKGDLGIVAEASRSTQRMMFAPPKLTVHGVFAKLKEIAFMSGTSSMSKKVDIIKGLFVACRQSEARYLIRSLGGKLRIGLAEQSVLVAIAHAVVQSPVSSTWPPEVVDASRSKSPESYHKQLEEAVLTIKSCYCEHPSYDVLIPSLITHGLTSLPDHCCLTPGIPLKPMLAHPTKGIQEVLHRFESSDFTCEWKYDGERAQIHLLDGGETHVYSRNSENNTSKYPDIIARMPKVIKDSVVSCVIDSEAVAWDTEEKQILPFQVLSTRKRKDAEISDIKVQVCVYAFDLLYLNGKSLVKEPFKTRRELLKSSFNEIDGEFKIATSMDTSNIEEIQEFLEESIKGNCEGLMVKTLEKNATYEIAKRSHNWLKLKKDYLEGVGDTLDLVVVGGFHGTGKRTGRYGGFLLACYDEDNEEYQVICKIGTGFKDEDLEKHAEFFKNNVIDAPKSYYRHSDGVKPDHWFDPVQVWEVKAADLSISPVYTAASGIVDPEKGISLRFPRFLRVREDKKPEEATTSEQVASMYQSQQNVGNKASGNTHHDPEDFY